MTAADILRMIEHHGNVVFNNRTMEYETLNEHWIVNGKRFDHPPSDKEFEIACERGGE